MDIFFLGNSANTIVVYSLSSSPERDAERNASLGTNSRTLIILGEIHHNKKKC